MVTHFFGRKTVLDEPSNTQIRVMEDFEKLMLTEHLADLRRCLIRSFIAAGIGFAVCYAFIKDIGDWFFMPLYKAMPEQTSLIFISYQEAFFFT